MSRGYLADGTEVEIPVAKDDVVVNDAAGVPRKIKAGQPVPTDLVGVYLDEVGDSKASAKQAPPDPGDGDGTPEPKDWSKEKKADLEAEVEARRDAGREIAVEGTGKDSGIIAADLVKALTADDAAQAAEDQD